MVRLEMEDFQIGYMVSLVMCVLMMKDIYFM